MHKKGSLSLSINAIVIVVLAMTLLGLGLGFIKNSFSDITETTGTVQQQVKAQILEDLRTGNKKLSFPQTSMTIERGETKDIAIGVRNTKSDGDLNFYINFNIESQQEGTVTGTDLTNQVKFFYGTEENSLKVTEAEAYPVKVTGAGTTGTYLARITITEGTGTTAIKYAEKTFFVTII